MSKGMIVIDKLPEYCDYCPMARLFGVAGGIECKAAPEGHCVVGYGLRMKRPEWCPIKPAPNDDWIPVEERLPEEGEECLAQFEVKVRNTRNEVIKATYIHVLYLEGGIWKSFAGIPNGKVIAWRPLPEPYRTERSDGE